MKNENKQPEWVNITPDNLPPHLQVCEWLHPEYGGIIGNIVKYGGKLESEQSLWIFPVGGCEADIALSEFTHFRKVIQQTPSSPESKEVESVEKAAKEHAYVIDKLDISSWDIAKDSFIKGYTYASQSKTSPIEVIKKRLEFLEICTGSDIASRISECNDLLKLIQP